MKIGPGEMNNLAAIPEFRESLELDRRYLDQWIEESGDAQARLLASAVAE